MRKRECIAMLLAGGQGSRLGGLTANLAKPAVVFGGKYRMIDFTISNCSNSNIDVIGVLTQYKHRILNHYIGSGAAWGMESVDGGISILPPYQTRHGGQWYNGTADAVYQNVEFIDYYDPDYVLILSGDHIYKMDYSKMLAQHKATKAEATISVIEVPLEEASRFGIMTADENGRITEFAEKPAHPNSTLASMGIYIFNWKTLRRALLEDHEKPDSDNDFGKNIIPTLLGEGLPLYAYRFEGYWQDVGTIPSYYECSMQLLEDDSPLDLYDSSSPIYSNNLNARPQFIGPQAHIDNCMICDGASVFGEVTHSIISNDVYIGNGAKVVDSILLHGARIEDHAQIYGAIIDENVVIERSRMVGSPETLGKEVTVISKNQVDVAKL